MDCSIYATLIRFAVRIYAKHRFPHDTAQVMAVTVGCRSSSCLPLHFSVSLLFQTDEHSFQIFRALENAGLSVFLRLNLDFYANNLLPWILNCVNLSSVDTSKTPLKTRGPMVL